MSPLFVGSGSTGSEGRSDRFGLPTGTSDPGTAEAGDLYYNTDTNKIRYYDGTAWADLSGGSAANDPHAANRYIGFPFWNGGSGSSLVMNNNYGTSTSTTQFLQFGTANVTLDVGDTTTSQGGSSYGGSALFGTAASVSDNAEVLRTGVNDAGLRFSGSSSFVVMADIKNNDSTEIRILFGGNNGWYDADGWWTSFTGTSGNNRMTLAYANHTGNPTYYHVDTGDDSGLNGWHQFAWAYSGGTFSAYIDGVRKGQVTGVSTGTWAAYDHSGVDGGDGDTMLHINGFPYPVSFGSSDIIMYALSNCNMNDLRIYNTNFTGHAATIDVKPSLLASEGVV